MRNVNHIQLRRWFVRLLKNRRLAIWTGVISLLALQALLFSHHFPKASGGYSLAGIAAIGLFLLSGILTIALQQTRARSKILAKKLAVAEEQYAAVLNFNSAEFGDKSRLIELTLNHMNQGVAVIRPDGRFWLYNKRALDYTGVQEAELPFPPTVADVFARQIDNGEFGEDGVLLPQDARAFIYEHKGKPPPSYIRRRPNGTILEVRSDPMPGGSFIQTYTDITELAEAKQVAEAAVKAKANFLATMSHEIRTPLNGVLGAANLLAETPLNDQQRYYNELISSCGEALLVVINDILDFSKFESAGVTLDPVPSALSAIFRSAIMVTRSAADAKKIELRTSDYSDLPPAVLVDAVRLRQVIINLMGNAIKFTAQGSVTLHAEPVMCGDAALLRVSVIDTGIGITEEAQAKLFEEFSQENSSITRRFGGTGLGLAISKKIIEAMGGEIGVHSTPGQGSKFWFEIPLTVTSEPVAQPPALTDGANRLPNQRILVAEDIRTNQIVIEAALKAMGHSVTMTSNGEEALAALRNEAFDLVMLDMQMPDMDGLEATRRIRASRDSFTAIPIIAMTANAFQSDREACMEAGMNGFVSKPFSPDALTSEMIRVLAEAGRKQPDGGLLDSRIDKQQAVRLFSAIALEDASRLVDELEADTCAMFEEFGHRCQAGELDELAASLARRQTVFYDFGMVEVGAACDQMIAMLRAGAAPDIGARHDLEMLIFEALSAVRELDAYTD